MAKVLVVDDVDSMRQVLKALVSFSGHQALEAEDGQQALDLVLGGDAIDLIITDINMPNMDGVELIRNLRKNSFSAPIIVLTSNKTEDAIKLSKESGADGFIQKPVKKEQFGQVVDKYLKKAS